MDVIVMNTVFGAGAGLIYAGMSYLANKKDYEGVTFDKIAFLKTVLGAGVVGGLLGMNATTDTVYDMAMMMGVSVGAMEGVTKLYRLFKK